VWALTFDIRNTYEVLKNEFDNLERVSYESGPYFLALYSAALSNVGKNAEAIAISKTTTKYQNRQTGAVEGSKSSITSSRGNNLLIETTALCMINWIEQDNVQFY
jgi:hypothetical protein